MARERIVYYSDAANEDYAGTHIDAKTVGKEFDFAPTRHTWRVTSWFVYTCIAMPLVSFYCYLVAGYRVKNRKARKSIQKHGYFLYANHTHFSDAFLAPIVACPKRAFVLVSPDTVSIKGIRWLVQALGAVPIPQTLAAMPAFLDAVKQRIDENNCISIFPEAHLCQYCTFVRPFRDGAFRYPVQFHAPCIAVAVTYQKRRLPFFKTPRRTVFLSEPFFPDPALSPKAAQRALKAQCEQFITEKVAKYSTYAFVQYVKREEQPDEKKS